MHKSLTSVGSSRQSCGSRNRFDCGEGKGADKKLQKYCVKLQGAASLHSLVPGCDSSQDVPRPRMWLVPGCDSSQDVSRPRMWLVPGCDSSQDVTRPRIWLIPGCESSQDVSRPRMWVVPGCDSSQDMTRPRMWVVPGCDSSQDVTRPRMWLLHLRVWKFGHCFLGSEYDCFSFCNFVHLVAQKTDISRTFLCLRSMHFSQIDLASYCPFSTLLPLYLVSPSWPVVFPAFSGRFVTDLCSFTDFILLVEENTKQPIFAVLLFFLCTNILAQCTHLLWAQDQLQEQLNRMALNEITAQSDNCRWWVWIPVKSLITLDCFQKLRAENLAGPSWEKVDLNIFSLEALSVGKHSQENLDWGTSPAPSQDAFFEISALFCSTVQFAQFAALLSVSKILYRSPRLNWWRTFSGTSKMSSLGNPTSSSWELTRSFWRK